MTYHMEEKAYRKLADWVCGYKDQGRAGCQHPKRTGKYCKQQGCPESVEMERVITEQRMGGK